MLGLLLALGLASCQKETHPPRQVGVDAILPLSGPLSPAGKAFAEGLREGLQPGPSDSVRMVLNLLDNASSADSARQLLLMPRQSVVLAGIGAAATELPPRKGGLSLWVGQEGEPPQGWSSLAASNQAQADSLLAWCRRAPKPLAIVFGATAQWAPLVQELLEPRLDSLILIPHDGGETTWNREATRLLVTRPASVLLWHGLDQARSLMARQDLDSLLTTVKVLGPDGSGTRQVWGPVWEPSQIPAEQELAGWKRFGAYAAKRLVSRGDGLLPALPLTIRSVPAAR